MSRVETWTDDKVDAAISLLERVDEAIACRSVPPELVEDIQSFLREEECDGEV